MKTPVIFCLCCALALPLNASAYGAYEEDNPFVEAMLRMMEIFGLIDRNALPARVPYLSGYGQQFGGMPGLGGFPGSSPMPGFGGVPGMSPMYGFGGAPSMSGFPDTSMMSRGTPWSGSGLPYAGGAPGNQSGRAWYEQGRRPEDAGPLDGVWELENGGFVTISGKAARLHLSPEQYQDFSIGYDRQHFWWAPQAGGKSSRYRYQVRDGRMILSDEEGNLLLLRRGR